MGFPSVYVNSARVCPFHLYLSWRKWEPIAGYQNIRLAFNPTIGVIRSTRYSSVSHDRYTYPVSLSKTFQGAGNFLWPCFLFEKESTYMAVRKGLPSPPEIRVIQAVAKHGTIPKAAESLFLSPHTVNAHLDNLRRKSGLRWLPQLVAWAAAQGWLQGIHDSEALKSRKIARSGEGME